MKRLIGILMLMGAAATVNASEELTYRNEIGLSLFLPPPVNFNVHYERPLTGEFALYGGVVYVPAAYAAEELLTAIWQAFSDDDDWALRRYGALEGGVKYYPLGGARRFFVQGDLTVNYSHFREKEPFADRTYVDYAPAALAGWRWLIRDRLALTLDGGAAYYRIRVGSVSLGLVFPRADFTIGAAF